MLLLWEGCVMWKPFSVPFPFSLAEGRSDFKIWHFSLTLNLNIQRQKGKGVFQLREPGIRVALTGPSCGVEMVCAGQGVDLTAEGALSEQVGAVSEEGCGGAGCDGRLQC